MKCIAWLVLVSMAGCGAWRAQESQTAINTSVVASKYQFDYTLINAEPIALLRVFDDGGSTYFQFRTNPPEGLVISAQTRAGESILPHETMGNYAVVRGVYRQSNIPTATQPVVVRKLGAVAPMADLGPVVLPKPVREATSQPIAKPLPIATQAPASRMLGTHTVRFTRNRASLGPKGRSDLAAVIAQVQHASKIELRVRAFYPNRSPSVRLAKTRGETLRSALVKEGISEASISIDAQGAANPLVAEVTLHALDDQAREAPQTQPALITQSGEADHTRVITTSF